MTIHGLHSSTPAACSPTALALITLLCIGLFTLRMLGAPDLLDNDQQRPAAYLLDVLVERNLLLQTDELGRVMSKPPVSTWLTALLSAPFHRTNLVLLYLPCALATLAIVWMMLGAGGANFSRTAALAAATMYLCSPAVHKQIALSRSDTVFAAAVFAATLLAWHAWRTGRGFTWFWLAAAVATLTKGPLGVLLALGGLMALLLLPRNQGELSRPSAGQLLLRQLPGVGLYLGLGLGWFIAAYIAQGQALVDKMIHDELVGHAVGHKRGWELKNLATPSLYFLSIFAPWGILTAIAMVRAVQAVRRGEVTSQTTFALFLTGNVAVGIAVFSMAPHQRHDHLLPLLPAAGLLAGFEAARWLDAWQPRTQALAHLGVVALFFGGAALYDVHVRAHERDVAGTREVLELAHRIRDRVGDRFPLIHYQSRYGLQFFLNTHDNEVSAEIATELLTSDYPAYLVTREPGRFLAQAAAVGVELLEVDSAQLRPSDRLVILSNRPTLVHHPRMAHAADGITVWMDGAHLKQRRGSSYRFWAMTPNGTVTLRNDAADERVVTVLIENVRAPEEQTLRLAPSARVEVPFGRLPEPGRPMRIGQIADCRGSYWQIDQLSKDKAFKDIDLLVVNGDFVFEYDWEYELFLNHARAWNVPLLPVCGNHEMVLNSRHHYEPFMRRFGYLFLAFDWGPARIITLETGLKAFGEEQFEQFREALALQPVPRHILVFHHVPPNRLRQRGKRPFRSEVKPDEGKRFMEMAMAGGVERIYCGHVNVYEKHDYQHEGRTLSVVISGGGGEKTGEKAYTQHWAEMELHPDGSITEHQRVIATPPDRLARMYTWWVSAAYLVPRYTPLGIMVIVLTLALSAGVQRLCYSDC